MWYRIPAKISCYHPIMTTFHFTLSISFPLLCKNTLLGLNVNLSRAPKLGTTYTYISQILTHFMLWLFAYHCYYFFHQHFIFFSNFIYHKVRRRQLKINIRFLCIQKFKIKTSYYFTYYCGFKIFVLF